MSSVDFSSFLKLMVHKKASDLFITAGVAPSIKVHGRIVPITQSPLSPQESRDMVLNVMTPSQREEFEKTHECQFAIGVAGVGRFRVSCFYQRNCVGMVLRRIESKIPTIEELNLLPIVKQLAMTKRGIVIFVGATGAGKTTSLASIIGYRNQNSTGHIISIEDPIEYVHKHEGCIITQRELGIDTDSWENALKNTLRQAPDVILIGEVRTRETMEFAINFAETGHLCLCTLHANNANQAMDRILHFFPEDRHPQLFMDLSLNLKGVVAQQLIPTPDGKARRVAVEVLLGTPLVQDYIRKGEVHKLKDVMKESTNLGMKTFDQALFELYQAGEISYEDALRYADSANEVRLKIKLAQGGDAHTLSQGMHGVELVDTSPAGNRQNRDWRFARAFPEALRQDVREKRRRSNPPPRIPNPGSQPLARNVARARRGRSALGDPLAARQARPALGRRRVLRGGRGRDRRRRRALRRAGARARAALRPRFRLRRRTPDARPRRPIRRGRGRRHLAEHDRTGTRAQCAYSQCALCGKCDIAARVPRRRQHRSRVFGHHAAPHPGGPAARVHRRIPARARAGRRGRVPDRELLREGLARFRLSVAAEPRARSAQTPSARKPHGGGDAHPRRIRR